MTTRREREKKLMMVRHRDARQFHKTTTNRMSERGRKGVALPDLIRQAYGADILFADSVLTLFV